jgi:hypothetical protein
LRRLQKPAGTKNGKGRGRGYQMTGKQRGDES